jgi:cellulose synthase/poly-beta-1,6-N-acetylglucosamine synthase-like glycosyltransferase
LHLKLIGLASKAFTILAALIIVTQTFILLLSLAVTLALSAYLLTALKRRKKVSLAGPVKFPFLFFYLLLLLPIVVAALYSSEKFSVGSIYSIIISFGMTLTFMYSMVNLPLTIYHKQMEQRRMFLRATPRVTIIVPAYNEEKSIGRVLNSAVEADYPNKEVIVVDDGSVDNTYSVASRYKDKMPPNSCLVIRKPNGGKYSAINYAIRFASGEYVIPIDADSVMGRDAIKEIVKYFQQEDVVAVGGNIKVRNRKGLLTYCQALEYLVGVNMFKRAYDVFGVVMVVPGPLGGFRKDVLLERGEYDNDTLTEDFDTTLKALKTGRAVQASSHAMSFTEAPETLGELYGQRLRWNRGNLQTLIKHRDIVTNSRYGMLQKYGYPLIFLTMITLPFLSVIISAITILAIIYGQWLFILTTFLIFTGLEAVLASIAVVMDEEDWKLILLSPLLVIGYKHLIDFFTIKSVFDVLLRRKLRWT